MVALPVKGVTEPRASARLAENGGLAPGEEASLNACQGAMPSLVVQKAGVGFAMLMARLLPASGGVEATAGASGESGSQVLVSASGGLSLWRPLMVAQASAGDRGESAGGSEPLTKPCSSSRKGRSSRNGEGGSGVHRAETEGAQIVPAAAVCSLAPDVMLASGLLAALERAQEPDGERPQADRLGGASATMAVGPVGSAANPLPPGVSATAVQRADQLGSSYVTAPVGPIASLADPLLGKATGIAMQGADRLGGASATVAGGPVGSPPNPAPHRVGGIAIQAADTWVTRRPSARVLGDVAGEDPALPAQRVEGVAHPTHSWAPAGEVVITGESMESGSLAKDGSVSSEALVGMSPDGSLAAAESKAQSRAGFSPVVDRFLSGGVRATEQSGAPVGVADVAGQVSEAAATPQRSETLAAEEVASSLGLPATSTASENDAGGESEPLPDAEYALVLPEALVGMSPDGSLAAAESKAQSRDGFSPVADRFLLGGVRATEQSGGPVGVADAAGQVSEAAATPQGSETLAAEKASASLGLPVASTVLENDAGDESDPLPDAEYALVLPEALVGMSPDGSLAAAESNVQSRDGLSPVADRFLSGGVRATEQGEAPIGVADAAGQVSEAAATPQGSETPEAEEVASSLGLPVASTVLENDAGGESEALPDAEYALVLPQALVGMSPDGSLAAAESKVLSRDGFSPVADHFLSGGVRGTEQGGAPIGVADAAGQVSEAAATPQGEEVASSLGLPVASTVLENDAGGESEALPDAEHALVLSEPSGEASIPRYAQAMASAGQARGPEDSGVGSSPLGSGTVQLQEEPADPLDGEAQHAEVHETDLLIGWPGAEPNGPVGEAAEEVPVAETWLPMGGGTVEVAARMAKVISRLVLVDENRAVLQLHPPELGRMSIRVTMAGGRVTVEMLVQDQAVKALVEARLDQLSEALAGQGLRTAALSVQVGQHAQQGAWSWLPRRSNRRARPSRSGPVRVGAAHLGLANAILAGRDCTIDYWI